MVWLRGLFLLTVVACAVTTAVLWVGLSRQVDRVARQAAQIARQGDQIARQAAQIAELAKTNHTNLCQVEGLLLTRARKDKAGAVAVLKVNPGGVLGFSAAAIRAGIRDDDAAIKAATDPTC